MKSNLVISAIAAAVAVFSQGAFAQASSPTRAEVKSDAKAGALAPPGQGPGERAGPTKNAPSTKTRMERKEATKAAAAAGELKKTGSVPRKPTQATSEVTRMEVKDATKAAAAAGELRKPGPAPNPIGESQKK